MSTTIIVSQGKLPERKRLFGILPAAPELPAVGVGQRLVLLRADGTVVGDSSLATPGSQRFSDVASYVVVDVSERCVDYSFSDVVNTENIQMDVHVELEIQVTDSATAVSEGAANVVDRVTSRLRTLLERNRARITDAANRNDLSTDLQTRVSETISSFLEPGPLPGLPAWLRAELTSMTPKFSEQTLKHLETLRESRYADARTSQEHRNRLADVDRQKEYNAKQHDLELSKTESDLQTSRIREEDALRRMQVFGISPQDPRAVVFLSYIQEPTSEKMHEITSRLADLSESDRHLFIGLMKDFAANGVIDPDSSEYMDALKRLSIERSGTPVQQRQPEDIADYSSIDLDEVDEKDNSDR